MTTYYNEIDPYAAQWLRNLIAAGHIAPGDVDTRSITEVHADELKGYTQCHFFAGIGGWSLAARLAGWPDDQPLWTGSCPCQPFSAAGRRAGTADDRHLWPIWAKLISERRPGRVVGEQVANAIGHGWLDAVFDDLEAEGYTAGAIVLPACGVGAPHIRQRVWFAAGLGHGFGSGLEGHVGHGGDGDEPGRFATQAARSIATASGLGRLADADEQGSRRRGVQEPGEGISKGAWPARERSQGLCEDSRPSPINGLWGDADWLFCRDGKWRPVEPGSFPLAHGVPGRLGRLRAYGNAIVPQVAAEVIRAVARLMP